MGFGDEMDDLRAERDAKAPLTEDQQAAITRAQEFAHLNRNRPVFFDGTESDGEYTINGNNDGAKIIINIHDDDVSFRITGKRTASIDEIHFDRHAAKAELGKSTIADPTRVQKNRARQFAEENKGYEVTVEGHDDKTFTITGLTSVEKVEVRSEYPHPEEGYPCSLTTSVPIEDITFVDSEDHDNDPDGPPDLTNVSHLDL